MKSLEIVNSAEKDLKILIDLIKQNPDYDFSLTARLNNERLIRVCESLINSMSNPIKQDLEVLEIIRKSHLGDDDIFIRFLIASYMDIDEYNKVKQWLEVNK